VTDDKLLIHGTCVALPEDDAGWAAVLLRGPSGAGKSDLALRLIDEGACLVADDQTKLRRHRGSLLAGPPATIAGRIEVRGLGILTLPYRDDVPLRLVCDLIAPEAVERLPEAGCVHLADMNIPVLALAPFDASTPAKLRLGVRAITHGIVSRTN